MNATPSTPAPLPAPLRWELKLPYVSGPPLSLNKRMHWATERDWKTTIHNDVAWLLIAEKVPPLERASIWLEWTPATKRRRDTDNPEPTRKAAIDAIVARGLLPDDTPEYVSRPENVIREPQRGLPSLLLVIEGSPASRGAA